MNMLRACMVIVMAAGAACWSTWLTACPFCAATQQTISEEMAANDLSLLIELVHRPKPVSDSASIDPFSPDAGRCRFRVIEVLKGDAELCPVGTEIEILYFGEAPLKSRFYVFGVIEKPNIAWATPTPLTSHSEAYVRQLPKLPESGADRLAFFQDYLADEDPLLAGDAYDEFARSPYADVRALGPRMHRDKLLEWIQDVQLSNTRRRLFLTMLGVCGQPEDVPLLESLIRNEDRQVRGALDALVACYLNLKGPDGLPLIEDLFLRNAQCEYTDTYATIMALRVHGQEIQTIPQKRLVASMRLMLDRPKLADLVIPDLARWQDWGAMDKLVQLFKNSIRPADQPETDVFEDTSWVRVPVIQFLKACPEPKARQYLAELEALDPDSFRRASYHLPFGMGTTGATRADAQQQEGKTKGAQDDKDSKSQAAPPADADVPTAKPAGEVRVRRNRQLADSQFSVIDEVARQPSEPVASSTWVGSSADTNRQSDARRLVTGRAALSRPADANTVGAAWYDLWQVPLISLALAIALGGLMNGVLRGTHSSRSL